MEDYGNRLEGMSSTVRKKRSHTFRRPRPESRSFPESRDVSSLSSTPPCDDVSKASSDENIGADNGSSRKEINLNQCAAECEKPNKRSKKEDVRLDVLYANSESRDSTKSNRGGLTHKRSSEGVLAPANWKNRSRVKESSESQLRTGLSHDGLGNENKVKKVTLKVGGVTRTIDANSSGKSSRSSEIVLPQQKMILKDNSDYDRSPMYKKGGLQGIPWKDFSRGGFSLGKEDSSMGKTSRKNHSGKQGDKSDQVRKSRRVAKKRVIDGAFDDEDEDDEIRYLEKLKNSKFVAGYKYDNEESGNKHRRLSKASRNFGENMEGKPSTSGKEGKKKSPSEDTDYEEEEELLSDCENEGRAKKKPREEPVDLIIEPKREMTLTTRQRALQFGKDASASGGSLIEFPNGLPPAPPKKQKEKLSDVEQQLKKAEAAQRRRMQNEKAARESQDEAIRKILGQDSYRKKREEKKKKRQEELSQEKAADALIRASSTIRWVMGPNGNIVTFPKDVGLPHIFDPKPFSYPPPREKCAGPTCTNPYKYRDSKTNLPLCSLHCYKVVQMNRESGTSPANDVPAH
ncbi:hypothetical protein Nepgr_022747 [Nepenthes gracilis]|uniref:INO80 complex subunit B-like conserved region domain-containing protein n=1 Tax=Nepenthes gracilis TaxID=150966 RepID=A0AAD3T199_NEPGR|nr:hypothetical protein Nepgr_022747 [Nepenthes gracilis]